MNKKKAFKILKAVAVLPALASVTLFSWPSIAAAHGKDVRVEVASLTPNPDQPLRRLYRAQVLYTDGDPVKDAKGTFAAQREDGRAIEPVPMGALGSPGAYGAEVIYPRYGAWSVVLRITEPGETELRFEDEVLPSRGQATEETGSDQALATRLKVLQGYFRFDAGDILDMGIRVVHVLSGVSWFGLTGAVLAVFWLLEPGSRGPALVRIARVFPPVAIAGLGGLFASGVYTAIYGAPILPPGILDLPGLLRVPFGGAYLGLFLVKVGVLVPLVFLALAVGPTLRTLRTATGETASQAQIRLKRLALVSVALGLLLALDVTALLYLHNLSHLALVLPPS